MSRELRPRQAKAGPTPLEKDPALQMLLTGKRIGLSFDEISLLNLNDFAGLVDASVPEDSDAPRGATQSDIDAMLG